MQAYLSAILDELLSNVFREELHTELEVKGCILAFLGYVMCHHLYRGTHP